MATVVNAGKVKLNNGQIINAKNGEWHDGQQYWDNTLSAPGVINTKSNQQGAGQRVSNEVIAQTSPNNVSYIQKQQQTYQPSATSQPLPPATPQPAPSVNAGNFSQAGTTSSGETTPTVTGFNQPTIDLPSFYKNLYTQSGISELEKEYLDKEKAFIEAKGTNNDNPFLSEGKRVGREAKLQKLFDERTANLKNDIATKKADIETQLNIQTKQFDINSQQAKLALDQFNTLLGLGAFNNASGEDIAQITRATGLSSSMIRGAIDKSSKKDVKTSVISFDDGTNQGFAVVNTETGEVINKQNIATSKPKATTEGQKSDSVRSKAGQLLEKYRNSYGHVSGSIWQQILAAYIQDGGTREDFVKNFSQYTDPNRGDFDTAYGFGIDKR